MGKIKLNATDNIMLISGTTKRVTVCAWDSVNIEKNMHNSSKVNLDTKFYFDHINDENLVTLLCDHYNVTKYYECGWLTNPVIQVAVIPASVYTSKGMKNGFLIINNSTPTLPIVLLYGEYTKYLYDNPTEPGHDTISTEYYNLNIKYSNKKSLYNKYDTELDQLISNRRKELEDKYNKIIDEELNEYKISIEHDKVTLEADMQLCKRVAKNMKYLADALHIDLQNYTQLFDND